MKNNNEHINLFEKYAIISLAYLFKSIRYFFRICYKFVRLVYRTAKKIFNYTYQKLAPFYTKLTEKIYLIACKTFDVN